MSYADALFLQTARARLQRWVADHHHPALEYRTLQTAKQDRDSIFFRGRLQAEFFFSTARLRCALQRVSADEWELLHSRSTNRHRMEQFGRTGHYATFYLADERDLQVLLDILAGRTCGMVERRTPDGGVVPPWHAPGARVGVPVTRQRSDAPTLDDTLLEAFMQQFYGYGSYAGRFWLVGMEEGGGATPSEIARRLETWEARGRRELEDLVEFTEAAVSSRWFGAQPALQSTWSRLIRLLIAARGTAPTKDRVRAVQARFFGRPQGDHCLLELLPLPAPSTDAWTYDQVSSMGYLATRASYTRHIQNARIAHLQRRIAEHRPTAVIFYGPMNLSSWLQIAGTTLQATNAPDISLARRGGTVYLAIKHPTARGMEHRYFDQAGSILQQLLD